MKLTPTQTTALKAMPFEVTMWGGKPIAGWPGRFTVSTLQALIQRGLVKTVKREFKVRYEPTPSGVAALETMKE